MEERKVIISLQEYESLIAFKKAIDEGHKYFKFYPRYNNLYIYAIEDDYLRDVREHLEEEKKRFEEIRDHWIDRANKAEGELYLLKQAQKNANNSPIKKSFWSWLK